MTIVKIGHRGALNTNHEWRSSSEKGHPLDGDLDGPELAHMGCELAIVGDQICNIPYDLYDLSDLKDILSVETWNSCLTEEERFHLSAYLPDMDQVTFDFTIKDLLKGDNFFFGSPMEKVFHGLKGGFYSVQVAPLREGLQLLQKPGHYHSLRLYHECMLQKFADMKQVWSGCLPCSSVEGKVRIWNKRKDQKPVLLVDLNAIPADEDNVNKGVRKEEFPLLKKTRYMQEEEIKPDTPAIDLNSLTINTNKRKGKGVLKVRTNTTNSSNDSGILQLQNHFRETGKQQPKGVLKIKPKFDPFGQQERAMVGTYSSRSSPPLSYLHHRISDENPMRSLDQQREEFAGISVGSSVNNFNLLRNRLHNAAELQEETIPSKNPQRSKMQSHEIPQILTLDMFPHHLDDLEHRHEDHISKFSTTSTSTVVSGVETEIIFPITYRRKKAQKKLDVFESVTPPSIVPNKKDFNQRRKAKTVKIKVRGWSEHNSNYTQGFLSGLQHGSPSPHKQLSSADEDKLLSRSCT